MRDGGGEGLKAAVAVALRLRDDLPADRKKGNHWIYAGLRGPLDRALIELASKPSPEAARDAVDAMVSALRGVDRNRSHRERGIRFKLLPAAWASIPSRGTGKSFARNRLAFAIASLRPTFSEAGGPRRQMTSPLLAYWLGAENKGPYWSIRKPVPFRRVWGGELAVSLAAVLQRRLIEEGPRAAPPFQGVFRASGSEMIAFADGETDDIELAKWIFRFSLFSVDRVGAAAFTRAKQEPRFGMLTPSGALLALFKPLFNCGPAQWKELGALKGTTAGNISVVAALLGRGDVENAVLAARRVYSSIGIELADINCKFDNPNPWRLLAALLYPRKAWK